MILCWTFLVMAALAANVHAGPVMVTEAMRDVEDPALRLCIQKTAERENIAIVREFTGLKCHSQKITSVNGLESFGGLTAISLHNNRIEVFEPSYFSKLESLNLTKNRMKTFSCQGLGNLKMLYVIANDLSELSLADLPRLEKFKVNRNRLVKFEHENLPRLKKAYLFDNQLEHTSLHESSSLVYLDVRQNPMSDELYEEMDTRENMTILHDGNAEDWQ